jgi:hypothetical protein
MAETEQKKKLARKPSDEVDPETGMPYENIPGVEYPSELEVAESLLTSRPGTPMLQSAIKGTVRQAGRDFEQKALQKMKAAMPSREEMQQVAIREPSFNDLMNRDYAAAQRQLQERNRQALMKQRDLDLTKGYNLSPSNVINKLQMPEK